MATVVGFYAVSIPFMSSATYLASSTQKERYQVSVQQ